MDKKTILIVEDESLVALDLQARLEAMNYFIPVIVDTGEDAIKKAEELKPDLILMDIVLLGDVDGIEAADQIRSRFDIPVIYLTANTNQEILERAKITEPFGFLIKPFEERELHITIDMALYKDQMEKRLKENEERHRSLIETMTSIIWIADASGGFLAPQPSWEKFTGQPWSEHKGFGWTKKIHPGDRERIQEGWAKACRELSLHETWGRVWNASLNEWRDFELRVVPIMNLDGSLREWVGGVTDISERKKVAEELNQYAHIVSSTSDMMAMLNKKFKYVAVNAAYMAAFGKTKGEFIGHTVSEVFGDEFFDKVIKPSALNCLNGENVNYQAWFEFPATGRKYMDVRYSPYIGVGDEVTGFVVNARDTSVQQEMHEKQIEMEKQVQHAQKLESLGVLAGGIAHDFNNILTSVLGYAELALEDMSQASPARSYVEAISESSKRAADLTRQMLAYSGKGRFIIRKISLNEIIEEMVRLLEVSISKNVILKYNLSKDLPAIEVDVTQIHQVVMNLIINASEAIEDKSGVISITTGAMECSKAYLKNAWRVDNLAEGLYVYLEIADTGFGMDKEAMEKVFEPFFTTKFTGRGLGMAAVQGIVRGHKGAINIYSEVGKGTTFKILFPATYDSVDTAGPSPDVKDKIPVEGVVLLVDDEVTVQTVGKRMLEGIGLTVVTASDGVEALEIYRKRPGEFALVLLDLTMPRMGGEECFRELRQIDKDLCIIMTSGYSEQDVAQKFIGRGMTGFIEKPFHMANMRRIVREAISKRN